MDELDFSIEGFTRDFVFTWAMDHDFEEFPSLVIFIDHISWCRRDPNPLGKSLDGEH